MGLLPITFRKVLAVCDSVKWEIISNAGSIASFFPFKLKTNQPMKYVARYIYKRPYNGTYAKNYIYVTENNEMLIQTILLVNKSDLALGEKLLREFKDKQLIFRETFFSLGTAYVIGNIAVNHKNDSSIKGHFTVKLKNSSNL